MMTYCDKKRPSARDMLKHDWIREGGVAGSNVIEPEVLHRMRSFAAMNKLKKKALLVRQLAINHVASASSVDAWCWPLCCCS
jgi:hypothetical protein